MRLRNYVNDLEFSKKVNYSGIGRTFENGDFARSLELSVGTAERAWNNGKEFGYAGCPEWKKLVIFDKLIALPLATLTFFGAYVSTKFKLCKPESYKKFSNNPDLILNH